MTETVTYINMLLLHLLVDYCFQLKSTFWIQGKYVMCFSCMIKVNTGHEKQHFTVVSSKQNNTGC